MGTLKRIFRESQKPDNTLTLFLALLLVLITINVFLYIVSHISVLFLFFPHIYFYGIMEIPLPILAYCVNGKQRKYKRSNTDYQIVKGKFIKLYI